LTETLWQIQVSTKNQNKNMDILVKYFKADTKRIARIEKGDWIDLSSDDTIHLSPGDFKLVPLGIAVKLPIGYEAHLAPRSSTFKNWGVIQTNGVGIVDESYCGDGDQWFMPVYATRETTINRGDRICQFRIVQKMPIVNIIEAEKMEDKNRGGHGSTGKN